MWREDNDKILEILNYIYSSEDTFPVFCPVCGKRDGHIYMHAHAGSQRGGIWLWCSACHHTSHSSYRIPLWWKNLEIIDESRLVSFPDYLEGYKMNIDNWVNKLKADNFD